MFATLDQVFVNDLIPLIDKTYRTLADRDHRAMAGLSMGGMQARAITMAHLDTFSHVGVFSGGSFDPSKADDVAALKAKAKLVFVSYGSRELENRQRFGGDPKANVEGLRRAGINAVFYVSPGTAHEWHTWRRSLHEFAPLLFREQRRRASVRPPGKGKPITWKPPRTHTVRSAACSLSPWPRSQL
jgi:enterochelin esterase family protein